MDDRVLFVERSGELIFSEVWAELEFRSRSEKASLKRAYEVAGIRPETG